MITRIGVTRRTCLLVAFVVCGCATSRIDRHISTGLESRIVALDAEASQLRAWLDSLRTENDSLRRNASGLESSLRDRETQILALRLELQRLKEIDLKPRRRRPSP